MKINNHPYQRDIDFDRVSQFLINNYLPDNMDGNWLQPAWDYMHSHPNLDVSALSKIGIWEANEEIKGVVHYESSLGEAFFQVHPDFTHLKTEMLDYAEEHLVGKNPDGELNLLVYVNDFDHEFETIVSCRQYEKKMDWSRPLSHFRIPNPFPEIHLPNGFKLKSLAEDNDLWKMHRVLWRGFNHPGEPPEEGIVWREQMQSSPNFRHDLTIVVEAPDSNFVSFCGMWHEKTNHIAYVEPVATDPDYRRMGLGRAAVMEGIRRCAVEGATIAYVGSNLDFYKALGFREIHNSICWLKKYNK